jgi:peptidyl-dipeptidase A
MKFSTFRGKIGDKKVTANEIDEILKSEKKSGIRKAAWEASKHVGPEVAQDLVELVKLRNQAAKNLGFENFYTMSMYVNEQSVEEVDKIFSEMARLTEEPFIMIRFFRKHRWCMMWTWTNIIGTAM